MPHMMKHCPKCASLIPEIAGICSSCGRHLGLWGLFLNTSQVVTLLISVLAVYVAIDQSQLARQERVDSETALVTAKAVEESARGLLVDVWVNRLQIGSSNLQGSAYAAFSKCTPVITEDCGDAQSEYARTLFILGQTLHSIAVKLGPEVPAAILVEAESACGFINELLGKFYLGTDVFRERSNGDLPPEEYADLVCQDFR